MGAFKPDWRVIQIYIYRLSHHFSLHQTWLSIYWSISPFLSSFPFTLHKRSHLPANTELTTFAHNCSAPPCVITLIHVPCIYPPNGSHSLSLSFSLLPIMHPPSSSALKRGLIITHAPLLPIFSRTFFSFFFWRRRLGLAARCTECIRRRRSEALDLHHTAPAGGWRRPRIKRSGGERRIPVWHRPYGQDGQSRRSLQVNGRIV